MSQSEKTTKIAIGGRKNVCPDDVIMFKAESNYSIIYLVDGNEIVVATTLKTLEERFKKHAFIRMNRAYMVNSRYVVEERENAFKLTNSLVIPFSRRKGMKWRNAVNQENNL